MVYCFEKTVFFVLVPPEMAGICPHLQFDRHFVHHFFVHSPVFCLMAFSPGLVFESFNQFLKCDIKNRFMTSKTQLCHYDWSKSCDVTDDAVVTSQIQ